MAVITAHGNMENAIAALKAGAFDYLSKPVDLEQLRLLVRSALAGGLPREQARPAAAVGASAARLVGNASSMLQLRLVSR